jgi:FtsP/CotA-like multicopper oxidase with cupredoxin domain
VRILFRNLLPSGVEGNLFILVDMTVMGSGMGALMYGMEEMDPQNPMCGMEPKPVECYTENRAVLHLHGGISPWISDGTPHQWITPAGDTTPYKEGVSVLDVPDMPDPGPGAQTYYYTNQQSARLMFYHDHVWGITRLNVYAGEAAGYLIKDEMELALIE